MFIVFYFVINIGRVSCCYLKLLNIYRRLKFYKHVVLVTEQNKINDKVVRRTLVDKKRLQAYKKILSNFFNYLIILNTSVGNLS